MFFSFNFITKKDLTEYNIEKTSLFLGTATVIFSCTFLLITINFYLLIFPACAGIMMKCRGLYVCASNKFKADTKSKH